MTLVNKMINQLFPIKIYFVQFTQLQIEIDDLIKSLIEGGSPKKVEV